MHILYIDVDSGIDGWAALVKTLFRKDVDWVDNYKVCIRVDHFSPKLDLDFGASWADLGSSFQGYPTWPCFLCAAK